MNFEKFGCCQIEFVCVLLGKFRNMERNTFIFDFIVSQANDFNLM